MVIWDKTLPAPLPVKKPLFLLTQSIWVEGGLLMEKLLRVLAVEHLTPHEFYGVLTLFWRFGRNVVYFKYGFQFYSIKTNTNSN